MDKLLVLLALIVLFVTVEQVKGHGRLVEPPSRSTAWRYNFNTPKNYNDHEIYCGGWSRQHQTNKGKCGVCGDAWDLPVPRPNEGGGEYGTGVIVRTYQTRSVIDIGVELTANHQGFFEFHLCPHNNPRNPEAEDCFSNQNILQRADGQGTRYYPGPGSGIIFTAHYLLPADLTCSQCVLRWRYVAGNNWGTCANGTSIMGCGPQEEFRACADVQITKDGVPGSTTQPPKVPKTTSRRPSTGSSTTTTESTAILEPSDTSSSSPGSYAGVVIALATLLFAILFILGIIIYFYRGHAVVKQFLQKHFQQEDPSRRNPVQPQVTVLQDPKPTVPPPIQPRRIHVRNQPVIISEPIQVAINGVPVDRDGDPSVANSQSRA